MFFGGNKNINRKLGAFIIAFVFVFGLFGNFDITNAMITDTQINNPINKDSQQQVIDDAREFREKTNTILQDRNELIELLKSIEIDEQNLEEDMTSCTLGDAEICSQIDAKAAELNEKKEEARKLEQKIRDNDGDAFLAEHEYFKKDDSTCGSWKNIGCHIEEAINRFLGTISNMIIEFVGLFLRFSGILLNQVISMTIEDMGKFLDDNGSAIKNAWSIIRDIINIIFIFGLLFVSLSTIIRGIGQKTKQLLVTIIASALLINFSYLFTSVLIDTSNYLTIEIKNNIDECGSSANSLLTMDGGISNCVMNSIKLQSVFNWTDQSGFANAINPKRENVIIGIGKIIVTTIFSSFFIIMTGMVFLMLAILLMIRFIKLIFLLITSPVMFLGWVLPQLSGISKRWSHSLSEQLLFPPLVFLFIYISISIAKGTNIIDVSFFGIVLNYILIMGFMIGSIVIAQKTGATGASFATKAVGAASIGLAARGTGSFGRRFIGRPAANWADKIDDTTRRGQLLKGAIKGVADRSFDVRNTKAFEGVAKATGLTGATGTAITQGYRDRLEEKANKEKERYERMTKSTDAEERTIESHYRKIEEDENAKGDNSNIKKIKDNKKELEIVRQDIRDISDQKKALKGQEDTQEYKDLEVKEKAISMKLSETKNNIINAQKELEQKYRPELEAIKAEKKKAKERGKKFEENIKARANKWYAQKLGTRDELASRKIAESSRNKDGNKGELTLISDNFNPDTAGEDRYAEYEEKVKKTPSKKKKNKSVGDIDDEGGWIGGQENPFNN